MCSITCMGLGSRGTQVSILPCFLGRKFSELRSKGCQNSNDISVGAAMVLIHFSVSTSYNCHKHKFEQNM